MKIARAMSWTLMIHLVSFRRCGSTDGPERELMLIAEVVQAGQELPLDSSITRQSGAFCSGRGLDRVDVSVAESAQCQFGLWNFTTAVYSLSNYFTLNC